MDRYIGWTVPLDTQEVFALREFGEYQRGKVQLYLSEFVLHGYPSGEIQYEAFIEDHIYMFTQADLDACVACPPGHFCTDDYGTYYHLSNDQVYELQVRGETMLWENPNPVHIRISGFQGYSMGGNHKHCAWVDGIVCYYYSTQYADLGPY